MSFLPKPPNKTLYSFSILRRFSAATTSAAAKPFPDAPTAAYYDELAFAAGTSGDLQALRDLLNKRFQDGIFTTKNTFSFITNTTFSPSLLDDVVRTLSTLNPGPTRKASFESLLTRLCKLQRVDHALGVIDIMARDHSSGYRLSASTFFPVLSHLTRRESIDHARRVVDFMGTCGVRLDLTSYNYFIMAHCAAGELEAAAGVLREMEEEGLSADARTFDALVLGACKVGRVEGAMVLVRKMVDDGVPMLYSTHMYVIGGLLKLGCFDQAVRYVRGFGGRDESLDAQIFGCLASKLVGLDKFKVAMVVLEEMNQRGLPMGHKLRKFYEKNASKWGKSSG